MEELPPEQHDYLMAACARTGGKNNDEAFTGEDVTGPAGVDASRETAVLLALKEKGLVTFDAVASGQVTITAVGKAYCERYGEADV